MSTKRFAMAVALLLLIVIWMPPPAVVEAAKPQPSVAIENPYVGGVAFKGQLHSHTENCNAYELEMDYRDNGFNFISITDHNIWTASPNVPGILHIDGSEQSVSEGHLNILQAISPTGTVIRYLQANHPNRLDNPWTTAELTGNTSINGLEVFNPKPTSEAEDKWDYALLHPSVRSVWGTAVDDYHGTSTFSGGLGWVMVYAPSLTAAHIVNSLRSGNFYASTGPTLVIEISGQTIKVTTDGESTFSWQSRSGKVLKTSSTTLQDSYRCRGNEVYVKTLITRNSDGKKAWTQPFFLRRA